MVLAADFREKTSLRDNIPRFGSVFFRKIDTSYDNKSAQDYDFGVQYDVSAAWKAVSGQRDENRMPHLFQIDPGMSVIEHIRIGGGPKMVRRGYDSSTNRVSYGTFTVRQGDGLNRGRLVVHMHFCEGTFSQRVEDNTEEVLSYLTRQTFRFKGKT